MYAAKYVYSRKATLSSKTATCFGSRTFCVSEEEISPLIYTSISERNIEIFIIIQLVFPLSYFISHLTTSPIYVVIFLT